MIHLKHGACFQHENAIYRKGDYEVHWLHNNWQLVHNFTSLLSLDGLPFYLVEENLVVKLKIIGFTIKNEYKTFALMRKLFFEEFIERCIKKFLSWGD